MSSKFCFIVPRMPLKLRNEAREVLYRIAINSLLHQKSKNWTAIILGHKSDAPIDNEHFVFLESDDFPKTEKLTLALNYLAGQPGQKPEYIIRLDADDIISPDYLSTIENLSEKYDLYYDGTHVCVDPIYMKISYRRNNWVANTAIHKYEHAIKRCGPDNEVLFLQDHDAYWHEYYKDKKVYISPMFNPLYYRTLTPFSITSSGLDSTVKIDWSKYLAYLNSYGPWIPMKKNGFFHEEIKTINKLFLNERPLKSNMYWGFNLLKYYKSRLFHTVTKKVNTNRVSAKSNNVYQECSRCILTTDDTSHIFFDDNGVCNYCHYYDNAVIKLGSDTVRAKWLSEKVTQIKNNGRKKKYDCILGVSGGVDSSYLAYWAKEQDLKPLIVHFDNGWNSELAVQNIRSICDKLGFELNTHVINWDEFRELQLAYIKAGVVDVEVLTDHAIMATIYKVAEKYGIKYTINGFNFSTEAIMPVDWVFDKGDWENIKDIYAQFGSGKKLKTYPHISFYKKLYYHWFLKLESIQVLNYIHYNKAEAKKMIAEKLNWRDYGGKHYESLFTKFYQAYILPTRFKIDKRKAHLSNLICSGQITKEEAYLELKKPLYNAGDLKNEMDYVLKKLGLSHEEFSRIMQEPIRKHEGFKTEKALWKRYFNTIKFFKQSRWVASSKK